MSSEFKSLIKDIRLDELGAIRIGRNVTEYAWNGKDEFGEQLANGIYLYLVMTSIGGEKVEQRESGADVTSIRVMGRCI